MRLISSLGIACADENIGRDGSRPAVSLARFSPKPSILVNRGLAGFQENYAPELIG